MKAGKSFEIFVEQIYKQLSSDATIIRNDKIFGQDSNIYREIDLSIRNKIAGHDILIIVQAKDYKTKVNIAIVSGFITDVKDVRASKGVLISSKGFTKGAISMAKSAGIELFTAHDSEVKDWNKLFRLPHVYTIIDRKFEAGMNIDDRLTEHPGYNLDQFTNVFRKGENGALLNLFDLLREYHKLNSWPNEEGEHLLDLNTESLEILVKGSFFKIYSLDVTMAVSIKRYFKFLEANEYKVLYNVLENKVSSSFSGWRYKTELNFDEKGSGWFPVKLTGSEGPKNIFEWVADNWDPNDPNIRRVSNAPPLSTISVPTRL